MKNILIALDCKPEDRRLIQQGLMEAKLREARIWLVHIAAPDPDFVGLSVGPQYIRDNRASELSSEHQYLHQKCNEVVEEGIECEALLIQGPTIEMIKLEIEKLNIDMLIMGSHKHSWFHKMMVGHSASKLVGSLKIPLLIIPLSEED